MNKTIKAIERHMVQPTKPAVVQPSAPRLIAEWQQRGNAFRTRTTKVAFGLCAGAVRDNGKCSWLGGASSLTKVEQRKWS
jgi:hypothetical protein